MEKPEKELIEQITDLFEDYEEAYVPGEWEAFSEQHKKRRQFPWAAIRIAALLALCFSALFFAWPRLFKTDTNQTVVSLPKSDTIKGKIVQPAPAVKHQLQQSATQQIAKSAAANAAVTPLVPKNTNPADAGSGFKDEVFFDQRNDVELSAQSALPVQLQSSKSVAVVSNAPFKQFQSLLLQPVVLQQPAVLISQVALIQQQAPLKDTLLVPVKAKMSTIEFLAAESRQPAKKGTTSSSQNSKWDFGLEVAPTMTSSNMNFGGGLTTAYRLSDKFAISSGLSLLQLQSATDVASAPQATASLSSLSSRELLAVDANIKAIDIPLAIVYNINKNFYTSAGISYFNVISEKRSNTYEQASASVQTVSDPVTGYASDVRTVVSQAIEVPGQETRLKGNSYLGFFNFSIGRRQNIFNKYNVLIEPFIKVPVGKLSAEDLKLTNSGLKFQFSF